MSGPDEGERLARRHLWRCEAIARYMTRRRPRDYEEAYSVALVGLAETIAVFCDMRPDECRAQGFGQYAHARITARIADSFKAERPKGQSRRLGRLPLLTETMPVAMSTLPDGPPPVESGDPPIGWAAEWEDWVRALARRLPGRQGEFLVWRYLHADAATDRAAGERLGITQPRATVLHHQALDRLREHYQGRTSA